MWDELVAHARDDAPNECCGYLSARDGVVEEVFRAENPRHSPYGYELDHKSLFAANKLDDDGFEVGIYHSHPKSAAEPSQTDINLAHYPHWTYLIVSLDGRAHRPRMAHRGWAGGGRRPRRRELSRRSPARPAARTEGENDASAPTAACRSCGAESAPLETPLSDAHARARKIDPAYTEGELVRVAGGRNQAEAELIQSILLEEGVPSILRRSAGLRRARLPRRRAPRRARAGVRCRRRARPPAGNASSLLRRRQRTARVRIHSGWWSPSSAAAGWRRWRRGSCRAGRSAAGRFKDPSFGPHDSPKCRSVATAQPRRAGLRDEAPRPRNRIAHKRARAPAPPRPPPAAVRRSRPAAAHAGSPGPGRRARGRWGISSAARGLRAFRPRNRAPSTASAGSWRSTWTRSSARRCRHSTRRFARAFPIARLLVELRERREAEGLWNLFLPDDQLRPRPDQLGVRDALRG